MEEKIEKIRKYHRIYRICPKKIKGRLLRGVNLKTLETVADPPKRKKCLNDDEVADLLDGYVIMEEKMEGGVVGIAWNGNNHLAIGKHSMISNIDNSKKFYGLNSWIYQNYEKIQKIPLKWIVYGEWMRASHHIYYDNLKDFFICFDVWNGNHYLDFDKKTEFITNLGFVQVPVLGQGSDINIAKILRIAEEYNLESRFSYRELIEGVVIKNYDKGLMGKYVKREFMDSIEEHWLEQPLVENKLESYY